MTKEEFMIISNLMTTIDGAKFMVEEEHTFYDFLCHIHECLHELINNKDEYGEDNE